jgi:hypothetical protein
MEKNIKKEDDTVFLSLELAPPPPPTSGQANIAFLFSILVLFLLVWLVVEWSCKFVLFL